MFAGSSSCSPTAQYPPPPDDGQFNPNTELLLLLMEEATRQGDDARAAELAAQVKQAAQALPGPQGHGPQTNAYDVQLKIGRRLADTEPPAKGATFAGLLRGS